ncbi:serine/threonine-protein kinase, partial [Pirellulales bacterium]|nr:serine/threonine-protein kinase [Pirellulales bacterium]
MSTDWVRRALEVVEQALDIDEPLRAAWLRDACGGDDLLEAEVAAMLCLAPAAEGFLPLAEPSDATHRHANDLIWPAAPTSVELIPGSKLGDFEIEKQIGAGGMGVVYRAQQTSLHRPVALKVLPTYLRSSTSANTRFRREIEAAARLHHTNIVSVYATGEEAGTLYYAMELIDGPPLSHVLLHLRSHRIPELESATPSHELAPEQSSPSACTPDWAIRSLTGGSPRSDATAESRSIDGFDGSAGDYFDRVARALADVADALRYAHHHDVVHRDVKPSNLLLSSDGRLHISDFGLARFMQAPGMTRTGECLGTPYYMAPEQIAAESDAVDGRADVYSLGATLYELLTLQPPFVGDTRERIVNQITNNEPAPPRKLNKRIPHDLQTICLKALEKNPADRYQSGSALASDLRAYVNRFAISARRAGPIARAAKWSRRHRGMTAALVLASVLAVIAGFFAFTAHRSRSLWTATQQEQVFERAIMAALEGKRSDAQTAVEEARQLGAPAGKLRLLEGQVDLLAANYARAYEHFEQAAADMPKSVAAQALLARCCIIRHFYEQGDEVYRLCESLEPETLEDYLHRAQVEAYYDAAKAANTLDQAVSRNRASLAARLVRGEVQAGRAHDTADPAIAEAALRDYRIAAELLGNTPLVTSGHMRALLAAATAYQVQGESAKREETLRRAS